MAKEYKAYKLITNMEGVSLQESAAMIAYHKKLYEYVVENFNGFKQIGQWSYTSEATSDPNITARYLAGYFNLDNGNDKQILVWDHIDDKIVSGFPNYWSGESNLAVCTNNHAVNTHPEGVNAKSEIAFYDSGQWSSAGYEHWIMAYVDENDLLVGLSMYQKYLSLYSEQFYGGVMLFDRQKGKVYVTNQNQTLRPIAYYKGDDLSPQGQFDYTGKSQYEPYAVIEPVIVKDISDNFTDKYDGDVEIKSIGSSSLMTRQNQRITIGEQQYIHLGYGKLYLPISEYHEVTIFLD